MPLWSKDYQIFSKNFENVVRTWPGVYRLSRGTGGDARVAVICGAILLHATVSCDR